MLRRRRHACNYDAGSDLAWAVAELTRRGCLATKKWPEEQNNAYIDGSERTQSQARYRWPPRVAATRISAGDDAIFAGSEMASMAYSRRRGQSAVLILLFAAMPLAGVVVCARLQAFIALAQPLSTAVSKHPLAEMVAGGEHRHQPSTGSTSASSSTVALNDAQHAMMRIWPL